VLDQHDRGPQRPQLADHLGDLPGLLRIDPCDGLVQQQHLRTLRDGPGEFDDLAMTVGQFAGHLVRHVRDAQEAQDLERRPAVGPLEVASQEPVGETAQHARTVREVRASRSPAP
jgi:hypothetical protein